MALVATGLSNPRSIAFDSAGNLLVVQAGKGVSGHKVTDNGGTCINLDSGTMVVGNQDVRNQFFFSQLYCLHTKEREIPYGNYYKAMWMSLIRLAC